MRSTLCQRLESLYQQSIRLQYIEPNRLVENTHYEFFDAEYELTFKAQINYLRDSYVNNKAKNKAKKDVGCPLCYDNHSTLDSENSRTIDLKLGKKDYFAKFTPYPLFPYHAILIARKHRAMQMNRQSLIDLFHFIQQAPNYTCCSNSDVKWTGASILQHHHYQVFKQLTLPIQHAKSKWAFKHSNLLLEWLHYPIACCRISGTESDSIINAGGMIIDLWKGQRDKNTCNLLLDYRNDTFHLYIIFRHPGARTPIPIQKVKNEGIGIVEVAGYGIYPVPHGDNADFIWDKINNHGLWVIKSLITGNNPIASEQQAVFWQKITETIQQTTQGATDAI